MKRNALIIFYLISSSMGAQTMTVKQYIDSFKNIAMREMIEFKIPASITLAQGLLESGSGNSRLAKQGNNHFGIKCKKDWTGCSILEDDDDLQECFRCYINGEESYKDHSRFLKGNMRYANLFTLEISDYRGWANGLLKAGYATNKKYADLLISTIERNRLTIFDSLVLNGFDPYSKQVGPNIEIVSTGLPTAVVQPGESVSDIANANHRSEKKIVKYNDLSFHKEIQPGDVLYLRPKKRKAGIASHQVDEGETMWTISQKYAIRINSLYAKNLMEPGTEPKAGVILQLQQKALARPDTGRSKKTATGDTTLYAIHIVGTGETLYSICRLYDMNIESMRALNGLSTDVIKIGQNLRVSPGRIIKPRPEAVQKTVKHLVRQGETLYSISKLYKVGIPDIKLWNNLTSDVLGLGQELEIKLP